MYHLYGYGVKIFAFPVQEADLYCIYLLHRGTYLNNYVHSAREPWHAELEPVVHEAMGMTRITSRPYRMFTRFKHVTSRRSTYREVWFYGTTSLSHWQHAIHSSKSRWVKDLLKLNSLTIPGARMDLVYALVLFEPYSKAKAIALEASMKSQEIFIRLHSDKL